MTDIDRRLDFVERFVLARASGGATSTDINDSKHMVVQAAHEIYDHIEQQLDGQKRCQCCGRRLP